jgi:hypothetical protein
MVCKTGVQNNSPICFGKHRIIKAVSGRVDFLSAADADFAGLPAVNQESRI